MMIRKTLSPEQVLQKIRHFCAYQERSHYEVREKLYSFGLHKAEVEQALSSLIEDNYLNEERFAIQFAGGHFRLKQWGRLKIRQGLLQKKVSEYNIRRALREIDEEAYISTLRQLALKKWNSVAGPGSNKFARMAKTNNFLLQRGFEPRLVKEAIASLFEK